MNLRLFLDGVLDTAGQICMQAVLTIFGSLLFGTAQPPGNGDRETSKQDLSSSQCYLASGHLGKVWLPVPRLAKRMLTPGPQSTHRKCSPRLSAGAKPPPAEWSP